MIATLYFEGWWRREEVPADSHSVKFAIHAPFSLVTDEAQENDAQFTAVEATFVWVGAYLSTPLFVYDGKITEELKNDSRFKSCIGEFY